MFTVRRVALLAITVSSLIGVRANRAQAEEAYDGPWCTALCVLGGAGCCVALPELCVECVALSEACIARCRITPF
jgi:hypothetical protein